MIVHYMATYYSQWAHNHLAPRSQDQWYSFKFCRAVKSRRINGSLVFPWAEGPETINEQTVGRARSIFGNFIDHAIGHCAVANPILMPVPSKDGLIGIPEFRALTMVQESVAATLNNWRISSSLRFNQALPPAHAGGPRGRMALKPYLTIAEAMPAGPIILVDDIVTSGGSLLASYDVLAAVGRAPTAAIVCGHTVSDSLLSAFGHHQKHIDTAPQQIFF
jgi:hypothetical protein